MAYGGNADLGASQFAGAGFLHSQNNNNATDNAYGSGGSKKSNSEMTMRAVTIKQLLKDTVNSSEGEYKVDGVEISTVTILGRIARIEDKSAVGQSLLMLDDGTASMEVTSFNDDSATKANPWKVGSYVKVVGSARTFREKFSIHAYSIRPVNDHNEVTYHFLQAIFQHVHTTKGSPPAPGAPGAHTQQQKAPTNQYQPSAQPVYATGGNNATGGSLQDEVVRFYNENAAREAGVHLDEVEPALRQRGVQGVTRQKLAEACEFLCNEGQLYSTTDERTFRTCNS